MLAEILKVTNELDLKYPLISTAMGWIENDDKNFDPIIQTRIFSQKEESYLTLWIFRPIAL
jgi:hypothetical protein